MIEIVKNLKNGQNLSFEESKSLFSSLMQGEYNEPTIIEILESFLRHININKKNMLILYMFISYF